MKRDAVSKKKNTVEKYIKDIEAVSKEDIIEIANNIQINTIYFLTGQEKELNPIDEDD